MSQQLEIFEQESPAWIQRLWQTLDPNQREQILRTLAQMARDRLLAKPSPKQKETPHEPR